MLKFSDVESLCLDLIYQLGLKSEDKEVRL